MALQALSTAVLASILSTILYLVLQKAYPRPLPGIPYNRDAARKLMGDLAELRERQKNGGSMRPWFLEQAGRHNSAITQIFLGPFAKPAVLISDYVEVNDILSHRDAVDFKRGKKVDVFSGVLPHAHPAMETFDPRFKSSRDLVRDLMVPSFLNKVNAPHTYIVAQSLVELWRLKAHIAKGRPFEASEDIVEFSFDSILSAATGLENDHGDVQRQLSFLSRIEFNKHHELINTPLNEPIMIPSAGRSEKLAALTVDEESLWKGFYMPWPRLYHRLNKLRPSVRNAGRTLRGYIESRIAKAAPNLAKGCQPESALDYVIQREIKAAEKAGRAPNLQDPRIRDEIYGYLIAGHDTSTGSLIWLMRRLLSHPGEQAKIRRNLYETYSAARREKRLPTAQELTSVHAHYLDAFIEEVLRFNSPVVTIMVTTRRNTVVLGHPIPGDTQVFLNLTGPSLNMPSIDVPERDRSETAGAYSHLRQNWDGQDPGSFNPERWLSEDKNGCLVFNSSRGPSLAFSAGNRGCWGKRLGYLELRIILSLLVWSFDFDLPEELVSWDMYDSLVTAPKHCLVRVTEVE
ncbi:cytochrome P450 [Bipolaris maydis]|nr:cytochrome P450 [Bipolaris maydis]KAJ5063095.1 cytochrome P450 [Bipolaris maydis]KAJ6199369.1 cytochrome P450 [Bipolaris maydis]